MAHTCSVCEGKCGASHRCLDVNWHFPDQVHVCDRDDCRSGALETIRRTQYVRTEDKLLVAKQLGFADIGADVFDDCLRHPAIGADTSIGDSQDQEIGVSVTGRLKKLFTRGKKFWSATEAIKNLERRIKFYGDAIGAPQYQSKLQDDWTQIFAELRASLKKSAVSEQEFPKYFHSVALAWNSAVIEEDLSSTWLEESKAVPKPGKEADYDKERAKLNKELGGLFAALMFNTYSRARAEQAAYNVAEIVYEVRRVTHTTARDFKLVGIVMLKNIRLNELLSMK